MNENNTVTISHMMLETDLKYNFDLRELAQSLKIDVSFKDDENGLTIYQGDKTLKSYNITDNRKNILMNIPDFKGITKLEYADTNMNMIFHSPPKIIPVGCYCETCQRVGPHGHTQFCHNPRLEHLLLTLDGLNSLVYSGYEISGSLNQDLVKSIQQGTFDPNDFQLGNIGGVVVTGISISDVEGFIKKSEKKKFYPGAILLSFVYENSKSSSIRIQKNKIEIITCPWENYDSLIAIINRINEAVNADLKLTNLFIGSAFGISNTISEGSGLGYDLKNIRANLEKTSESKTTEFNDNLYSIVLKGRQPKGKAIFDVSNDGNMTFYKVTTMLYASGNMQFYFKIKDDFKDNLKKIVNNFSLEEQKKFISYTVTSIFGEVNNFIYFLFSSFGEDIFAAKKEKTVPEKVNNSIPGTIMNVDSNKIIPRDGEAQIQLFIGDTDKWWEEGQWSKPYNVLRERDTSFTIDYDGIQKELNKKKDRYRIHGKTSLKYGNFELYNGGSLKDMPSPFSFYGNCSPDKIVDFDGVLSRKDAKSYPKCVKLQGNKLDYETRFILEGNKKTYEKSVINDEIIDDKYCGTFKPEKIYLGAHVKFWNGEEWAYGTITSIDKMLAIKDKNGVTDPNLSYVEYTILQDDNEKEENDDEEDKIFIIRGENFHPMYRETRNFVGLNTMFNNDKEKIKSFLLDCARKLGINVDNHLNEVDDNVLSAINFKTLLPFTNNTLSSVTDNYYKAIFFPSHAKRCILFFSGGNGNALLETGSNYKVDIKCSKDLVLDTFLCDNKFYVFDETSQKYDNYYSKHDIINTYVSEINSGYDNGPLIFGSIEPVVNNLIHYVNSKFTSVKNFVLVPLDLNRNTLYYKQTPSFVVKYIIKTHKGTKKLAYKFNDKAYLTVSEKANQFEENSFVDYNFSQNKMSEIVGISPNENVRKIIFNATYIDDNTDANPLDKNMFKSYFWFNNDDEYVIYEPKNLNDGLVKFTKEDMFENIL